MCPNLEICGHLPTPITNGGGDSLWKWSNFRISRAHDLDLDLGLGHAAYCHTSLIDLYPHTKCHWNRRNFIPTNGHKDGWKYEWTDIWDPLMLWGRLRGVDLTSGFISRILDRQIDTFIYIAPISRKESLGASVAKEMCFQRSSKRIEGKSRPPQSGWKIVPQSRTGWRENPIAKFVVCSWHKQLLVCRDAVHGRTDVTDLGEVNIPGEEDDNVRKWQQLRVAQCHACQLVTDVVERRSECIDHWSVVAVWRYLGRNKLKILHHDV